MVNQQQSDKQIYPTYWGPFGTTKDIEDFALYYLRTHFSLFQNLAALKDVIVKDVKILAASTCGEQYLLTLEALWQKEDRPTINTKDEYKKRELVIMW